MPLRKLSCFICLLTLVLTSSSSLRAQYFEARASSAAEASPVGVGVGDFNGDGKQDMAVADFLTGQVEVLLGKGDGTFQSPVYYKVGFEPISIGVADFDGDGKLDLAIANEGYSISILLGNGDGTFRSGEDLTVNGSPVSVVVGDVNGDHVSDLTINQVGSCKCLSVLLGDPDGSFQPPIDTPALNGETAALAVGDFNRDGKLDAAMADQFLTSSELTVYLGDGDGTFQIGASYPVGGSEPSGIAVGDFRGIGKLDLAVENLLGPGVNIFLGNGDGTFLTGGTYVNSGGLSVTTADFNGDGKLDLASSNFGCACGVPAGATVYLGKGDGTFQTGKFYQAGSEDWFVAAADFNNDGQPDLAIPDNVGNTAFVLLNTGVVSVSPTTPVVFPVQLVGTTSTPQSVTLTNTGKKTLSINSISVTGRQFRLDRGTTCGSSLPSGGSCTIATTFQPRSPGSLSGIASIIDSASKKPQVIPLSGEATVVTLSPTKLIFPAQKLGTKSTPQTVTLTNTGVATLNISKVNFFGRYPQDYSQTNTCGAQVAPGASCTFSVTFAPTFTGTRTATLSIHDDGGGSPQAVMLSGMGAN